VHPTLPGGLMCSGEIYRKFNYVMEYIGIVTQEGHSSLLDHKGEMV